MPQEWFDDHVRLLQADTNAMSLSNVGDGVRAPRKRRSWNVEDKQRSVDESLEEGASIAEVARRYDLNANHLCTWHWRFGFEPLAPVCLATILPVTIAPEERRSIQVLVRLAGCRLCLPLEIGSSCGRALR
jgi:transposase-like protein